MPAAQCVVTRDKIRVLVRNAQGAVYLRFKHNGDKSLWDMLTK